MDSSTSPKLWISQRTTNLTLKDNRPQPRDFLISVCCQNTRKPLRTCGEGWEAYCRRTVFLAGLRFAFLYTGVLGFGCITPATPTPGDWRFSAQRPHRPFGSVWPDGHDSLHQPQGALWLDNQENHIQLAPHKLPGALVFSVFAPGSPFELAVFLLPLSNNSSSDHEVLNGARCMFIPLKRM